MHLLITYEGYSGALIPKQPWWEPSAHSAKGRGQVAAPATPAAGKCRVLPCPLMENRKAMDCQQCLCMLWSTALPALPSWSLETEPTVIMATGPLHVSSTAGNFSSLRPFFYKDNGPSSVGLPAPQMGRQRGSWA